MASEGYLDRLGQALAGCSNYTKLCQSNDSAVQQCTDPNLQHVPGLVSSQQALQSVSSLCQEMPDMQGCSDCSGVSFSSCPDPFGALSKLCLSMMMPDCKPWSDMCEQVEMVLLSIPNEDEGRVKAG
eukprot:756092-Hanusia_phi.AAC.7